MRNSTIFFIDKGTISYPHFDELSIEFPSILFLKVDTEISNDLSSKYNVMSLPTFVFIKENKLVDRFSGASLDKLRFTIIKNK